MNSWTVFYAWQSDLPRRYTRDFIHDAAVAAVAQLQEQATVEDAPRLDQDRDGVSGTPDLTETIYTKIEHCDVFLADVSLVGATDTAVTNKERKLLPNPNVMMELGYAGHAIGWDRIILVMNRKFGEPDELPFDLRNRSFPIPFQIDSESKFAAKQQKLTNELVNAITVCQQAQNERVARTAARMDVAAINLIREHGKSNYFSLVRKPGLRFTPN